MSLRNNSRYDIFFCHPSEDRRKATVIVEFLKKIIREALDNEYSIFFSPEDLKKDKKSQAWRKGINRALKECTCMIIYYTPNAFQGKWMYYEIGAMASYSKSLIPISTGAVDLSKTVINEDTVVNLATADKVTLEDWVIKIINEVNRKPKRRRSKDGSNFDETVPLSEDLIKKNINSWFSNEDNQAVVEKFMRDIRTQTIYIIGSKPRKMTLGWKDNFVAALSRGLLEREFNLASSPSVKEVGGIVAKECLATPTRYTIAGLHRFESDLYKTSEISDGSIKDSIKMFRLRYLKDIDAIIVIGGRQNTMSEIEVACDAQKPIFYIPCQGGKGEQVYRKRFENNKISTQYPCYNCNKSDCSDSCVCALCDYIADKLHNTHE